MLKFQPECTKINTMNKQRNNYLWWHREVIYQIYPRSYQDSNGDGTGDLQGIIQRLDHIKWLGIGAVWISPVYPSPMADFGYDISDYTAIHPMFGTLDDFDRLVSEIHRRNMKIIIDFVPNHTSGQHPWFVESCSSRDNPKRDWYIWKDAGPNGEVPNNWLSVFGGSGWEWDEKTGQFYYHAFLKEQPDLNWRNPEVQEAMFNVMRFWLDRGVDGFRVDVIWHMIKDDQFRDNPPNPDYRQHMSTYEKLLPVYSTDQPEVHDIIRKMRKLLDSYPERMMIGEIYLPISKLMRYYGTDNEGAHLPFNFQLLTKPWEAQMIASGIDEYEGALPSNGWPNWVLGNHDHPRITSRVGVDQAKVAAVLLLTFRGTPTIYYGDEIGMRDVPIPAGEIRDPQGLNMPGKNLSRDPARTPMQWSNDKNAGFSDAQPWLRINNDFRRNNVQAQTNDPDSILSLYKRLIELRQNEPALVTGSYVPVFSDRQMLAYLRKADEADQFLIVLNLSHRPCWFDLSEHRLKGKLELSTSPGMVGTQVEGSLSLGGDEAMVIRLRQE
jgi:alpha-glucosidase